MPHFPTLPKGKYAKGMEKQREGEKRDHSGAVEIVTEISVVAMAIVVVLFLLLLSGRGAVKTFNKFNDAQIDKP